MTTMEQTVSPQDKTVKTEQEVKTIFNILSKLKESDSSAHSDKSVTATNLELETDEIDDIVILRRDPRTKQSSINKSAYLKLHRSLSPNRSSAVDKIKEQYEKNDIQEVTENNYNKEQTLESLKNKYSPAGLGYTKSQVPVPKPRRTRLAKSEIFIPSKKDGTKNDKTRYSLNLPKNKNKDVNSNNLQDRKKENNSSSEEYVTIIRRSDSEESVSKFEKELSVFTMEKKKRPNSIRRIFSGKIFGSKDKKKKEEEKTKLQNKENKGSYTDQNYQNESNNFIRQSTYRHTSGNENKLVKSPDENRVQRSNSDVTEPKKYTENQLENDYAQMQINQFNKVKQELEFTLNQSPENRLQHEGKVPLIKPMNKNDDSNETYINMPNVRKYIDTSSSASTLESDRSNLYQNEITTKASTQPKEYSEERNYSGSFRPSRITDGRRDTPPRLLETKQDVRLVNPKALIPINSERPLPNPYQSNSIQSSSDKNSLRNCISPKHENFQNSRHIKIEQVVSRRPHLNDTYGIVFDSIEDAESGNRICSKNSLTLKDNEKPPRSPSVEPSKLKLAPNREILPVSPRVKSPIPSENVSTEKMIATELLKPKRSPTPTQKRAKLPESSHQRLEIDIDYPVNINYASSDSLLKSLDNLSLKPPVAAKPQIKKAAENVSAGHDSYRLSQASPASTHSVTYQHRLSQASPTDKIDRVSTDAIIHMAPAPNSSIYNPSLSPVQLSNTTIRSSTPSGSKIPESPKTTPQKQDIRRSVEAYYWKEIKKLKDQENYDLYLYQMQYGNMIPYTYAEDPVSVRRSRSLSPSAARSGRRSLSLPRDTKPSANVIPERYHPNAIPENRAVTNQLQPRSVQQIQFQQQHYFNRDTPERRTFDGSSARSYENSTSSLYRPIFKRGSLSTPPREVVDDSLKRKVSFSGATDKNIQSWPTKSGFTQSPPQRKIDKLQSQGDDEVFLPVTPKMINGTRTRYPSNANNRPDLPNEELYYNTRQNHVRSNGDTVYVIRNQNSLYLLNGQPAEENLYGQRLYQSNRYPPIQSEEGLYGQPIDAVRPPSVKALTRHGSIQINEELYSQRPGSRGIPYYSNSLARPNISSTPFSNQIALPESQYVSNQPLAVRQSIKPLRREIILSDEIFGQFGGYVGQKNEVQVAQDSVLQNMYSSKQSIADYNNRVREEYYQRPQHKQVSVNNKVCDIYGQIHDSEPSRVQQSGVVMGQLQASPGSPAVARNSYAQQSGRQQFMRNGRLTASVNDMYRRADRQYSGDTIYGKIEQNPIKNISGAPDRPLPPVPHGKNKFSKGFVRNNIVSDTESGSDASEIQRILNSSAKTKKRGIFGK